MSGKVDLYSHTIDPVITIEFLDGLGVGTRFPQLEGVATARYANQRFPKLPLAEAVTKYIEEEEYRAKNPPPVEPRIPDSVPEFIKEWKGVRVVDWGNDRDGRLVCIVEEENKYQGTSAHHLIVKGVSFTVSNKEEAEKIAEIVLNRAQNFAPQHKITGLHFGGTVVFVSMD